MTETASTPTETPTESNVEQDATDEETHFGSGDAESASAPQSNRLEREAILRYLTWAALGVCSLLAVYALFQFYGSVTETIDLWVEPRHQPLMHAAFNLVVLLGSLIGISLLVRELD
ncbi:hypothetical protein [Halopiger xanaduensis]|uniref:DUF8060 domain-containing protein n=1 Tax=Halopiger xanaduensis (strain DSM 18323 / JCM 14033 / SH-6) TaxID=797210 RepID=F8D6K4_HALXS|nr:hypothetical protein [Halopiger xanaduensis]AEH36600.1 hypothetical protein Halxa_1975 [Halopiger xanaduensis SH-6]